MKKSVTYLTLAATTILLAACGSANSQSSQRASSSAAPSYLVDKSTKIASGQKDPQQSVSIITTYAAKRYGGNWLTAMNQARSGKLSVNLTKDSQKFHIADPGQGVIYQVGDAKAGTVYTLGSDNDFYLYTTDTAHQHAKLLGHASLDKMIDYLNQQGGAKAAAKLATSATVVNNLDGSGKATTEADVKKGTTATGKAPVGQYGNEGYFDIPKNLQGTWYAVSNLDINKGDITKFVITAHTIEVTTQGENGGTVTETLYKQNKDWAAGHSDNPDEATVNATKNWARVTTMNAHGSDWINTQGWLQSAGDGAYYTVKTETIDGKQVPVLVSAGGVSVQADNVAYHSLDMAKANQATKFDDISYFDI